MLYYTHIDMEELEMKQQKFWKYLLIGFFIISMSACDSKEPQKSSAEFDEFIEKLPNEIMDNDNLNLEFIFEHPENYGFEPELLNLPYSNKEDYEASDESTEELLDTLESYDYDSLSDQQKMTYDILHDSLSRSKDMAKFYYLANSYLGSFIGFQAQLPLLLNEYTFETRHDLDSYFHILETTPETFQKYAEIEKERQANDVGMSKAILDKVIEQCDNFSKDKNPFLIETINRRIDQVSFLNDDEKKEAKAKNEKLLKESFVKGYADLKTTLEQIDAPKEEVGLAKQPNGKEYYKFLLSSTLGLDDSVDKIREYIENEMENIMLEMQAVIRENPKAAQVILQDTSLSDLQYVNFTSFEETIDYLGKQMKQDFPDVGKLNYDVTKVPDSMKDNFSPAAYLQGKIDAPMDAPEHIWVNGDYDQSLFETLAHEGYPGHMYQHTYFKQQKLPIIRYMIDYNGYSEGWATYIERNAWKYADVDDDAKLILRIASLNKQYTECIIALLDIQIHYDGISYEQYIENMEQYGIETDGMEEMLKEQWYLILETPSNYLQYYVTGFKFQDLYDKAKSELGDAFDAVKLNEALLKNGPAPFHIIEQEVDNYINSAK